MGPRGGGQLTGPPGVVERYLAALVAHDWTSMGDCLAPAVERIGPYGDAYRGRASYVEFLSSLLPTLAGYSMSLERVCYSADGRVAIAQLAETVERNGAPHRTPEALVFDIAPDGRIGHIAVYIQNLAIQNLAANPRPTA